MKFIHGAILTGAKRRADKSVGITLVLNELSPIELMNIDTMLQRFGYVYFKAEEELTDKEIEMLDNLDTDLYDNPKTQSQRIRNALFKLWQQDNKGFKEFKDFYHQRTEAIIQKIKDRLE